MIIANRSKNLLMAACLSAGVAFAPHVLAQEASQPPGSAVETPTLSDDKLQSFAVAFAEVEKVKKQYTQRLQEAGSETEQQQIQNEAGQKMLEAVEKTDGISLDEYNQIIQSAQTDPDLAKRLTNAIGQAGQ